MSGNVLNANFYGLITHSDGFCVGPLTMDGNAISIKTTNVQKIEGINFLGSDAKATQYSFAGGEGGLTGSVDGNGLVSNGALPEIIINPAGILANF